MLDVAVPFDVPQAPALYMLGLTTATTVPKTAPDLALNLLNGVDPFGNFQTGIALDSAPYIMARGEHITLSEYQQSRLTRILWSTGLSVATTKGVSDDDKGTRVGVGLKFTPTDSGDIRQDTELLREINDVDDAAHEWQTKIINCWWNPSKPECGLAALMTPREKFKDLPKEVLEVFVNQKRKQMEAQQKVIDARKEGRPKHEIEELENDEKKQAEDFKAAYINLTNPAVEQILKNKKFKTNKWNKDSISFGGGPTLSSENGSLFSIDDSGGGGFLTASYGWDGLFPSFREVTKPDSKTGESVFGGQIVGTARYLANQLVPKAKSSGDLIKQDSWLVGGRVRLGWDWLNFYSEVGYFDTSSHDEKDDHYWQIGFGGDIRLVESVYLSLGLGGTLGRQGQEDTFLISNLKWQWSKEPHFKPTATN